MDPRLSKILCCPSCHGRLDQAPALMTCSVCGNKYLVTESGQGIFMPETEAAALELSQAEAESGSALHNFFQRHQNNPLAKAARATARALTPPLFVYLTSRESVLKILFPEGEQPLVIDIGAGQSPISPQAVAVDVSPDSRAPILARAERLPFADASLDGVCSCGVLEHLKKPWVAAQEMMRVTKPGGYIYAETPLLQGIHKNPFDEQRFTPDGLETLFSGCGTIDKGLVSGPGSALAHVLPNWLALVFSLQSSMLYELLYFLFAWITFPIKYTDAFLLNHPKAFRAPFGSYFLGQKPKP
jgi:SAM-dependent methyltransferase